MSASNAVEAHGLVKRYGATIALGGIDLVVPTGTVTALLGPNGAGKTTAVRILATLSDADEGTATVAGCDVRSQGREVRRRIGLASQDATVDPLLTGHENLVMMGELHQLSRQAAIGRAVELLGEFALTPAADRVVSRYSGGMRRRLDLAATLVAHPKVLFLDEPTTGLDPRARNELWNVIDTLVDKGTTVLLTTQYLDEAERLADDIVVVDHGRIIAQGDSRSLKRQVGGDQVRVVVVDPAQVPETARLMAEVTESEPHVDVTVRAVAASTAQGVAGLILVAQALAGAGIGVDDLSLRQPTLNDVFLTLTGPRTGAHREDPPASLVGDPQVRHSRESHRERAIIMASSASDSGRSPDGLTRRWGLVHDSWVIGRRGLIHMKREPARLSDAILQPVMLLLLLAYVLGGAIDVPGGGSYRAFLMGGIMSQAIVYTAFGVAMSLAIDRKNQVVDRFRSLPIAKGAVLTGHAIASLIKALLPITLMTTCGLIIGWRIRSSMLDAVGGYLLLFAFAFAMIWIGILLGSVVATPQGVSALTLATILPFTFLASTFVPTSTMPVALRTFADWNPVTTLANAVRIAFGNPHAPLQPGDPWSLQHPFLYTLSWVVGTVIVCGPLAVRLYQRSISR